MPVNDTNWLINRPGPLKDPQLPNISAANRTIKNLPAQTLQTVYANHPQPRPYLQNIGEQDQNTSSYLNSRKFQGLNGRSQACEWNVQRPEVLFNNHSDNLLKHEYKRGMIIYAPVHEATTQQKGKSRAPVHCQSISAWGSVFTKPRYLIIVALHETEYTCIPLYSHNQEGLRGKQHYRNEFVSVRDGRVTGNFKAQSDLQPLVTDGRGPFINEMSTAWLTHPVSRSYDLNLTVCGSLKKESLYHLLQYMERQMKRGLGLR